MAAGFGAPGLDRRSARRRVIGYVVLLAASIILMAFSSSGPVVELGKGIAFAFQPFESSLTRIVRSVSSVASAVTEMDRLRLENARLRTDNERLSTENAAAAELKRENEALTGMLQMRNGLQYTTVAATVIARESSDFRRVVVIDQGTAKGIKVGDVVIALGGALAGRVYEATSNSASVVLISDMSSTVVGQVASGSATGDVNGQLGGVLVMENIDSRARVLIGEEIVTAGIALSTGVRSPYPKGLVIGQVVDVTRDANAVVQTAYLQPTADLDALEFVLVITDYAGGLPGLDQQPTNVTNPDGTLPDSEQPFTSASPSAAP